jgi:RNA polymerase sigma-70 factor (ECF subfamily)
MLEFTTDQYRGHFRRLMWRAYAFGFSRPEAEDIAQETMMAAATHASHLRGGEFRAWTNKVLRNKSLNVLRTVAHREMQQTISLSDPDNDHLHPALEGGQEEVVFLRQTLAEIDGLPERARRLLTLVAIEGRSYDDACRLLEIPMGTLKSALSRAHSELRNRLMDLSPSRPA